ncbi:MAG: glycosyltransferase family A protein, partial [Clostridium sp.]
KYTKVSDVMKSIVIITSKFNIMTGERNNLYAANEKERYTIEWLSHRMKIFMNYTLKSLINQTNQNFYAVYAYEDSTCDVINKLLLEYERLPDNIIFVKKSLYMECIKGLCSGYDLLYLTRLDSDDMYNRNFVNRLLALEIEEDTQAVLCKDGYIYNSLDLRLSMYSHISFTFYSFIYRLYKEESMFDSLPITPWDLLLNFFHFSVLNYNYILLDGRNFMFHIHSENTNSRFPTGSFVFYTLGEAINDNRIRNRILREFF